MSFLNVDNSNTIILMVPSIFFTSVFSIYSYINILNNYIVNIYIVNKYIKYLFFYFQFDLILKETTKCMLKLLRTTCIQLYKLLLT